MKLTIPEILKRAIETNDMSLVAKAYKAITGQDITVNTQLFSNQFSVSQPVQQVNKFIDDGTLARKDSPRYNKQLEKLYNIETAQPRQSSQTVILTCGCGVTEELFAEVASPYMKKDGPVFKCQRCILATRDRNPNFS